MSKSRSSLKWGVVVLFATGACATVAVNRIQETPEVVPAPKAAQELLPPPVVDPPPSGFDVTALGLVEHHSPRFPYLPGEDRTISRSVGNVSTGWLVNAVSIPTPHPYMAVLPVQFSRRLVYTSRELMDLVDGAARHVFEKEGVVTYLGNFGRDGGGDIPYSVSHNSGRDCDIAFFHVDAQGQPVVPHDLVPLDDAGEWRSEDGTTVYLFDAPRNWAFVAGLLGQEGHNLQYIFVSTPLRKALLNHAREIGADRDLILQAETVLTQPGGALPHNDHFHLRRFCSDVDARSGCVDSGRRHSGFTNRSALRRDTVRLAEIELASEDAERRLNAVRRLEVINARESTRLMRDRLNDEDATVRAAAARGLGALGDSTDVRAMAARLESEPHAQVRVELVDALARAGGKHAVAALAEMLRSEQEVELPGDVVVDARMIVADAVVRLEDPRPVAELIALLQETDLQLVARVQNALRLLTNHDFEADGEAIHPAWQSWHSQWGRRGRDAWLLEGFHAAGFEVKALNLRNVWELCRAILGPDYVSYNAQRTLMRLAGREVPSTKWSKEDASFYWRRWFERRCGRLGCPQIPEELSTLKGAK